VKICVFITFFVFMATASSQENIALRKKEAKIIYKYKKYERFDFEDFSIEGDSGGPGDLSITPRHGKKFKNKLPLRRNFNPEMRRAINAMK